jgi:hypothetical protein
MQDSALAALEQINPATATLALFDELASGRSASSPRVSDNFHRPTIAPFSNGEIKGNSGRSIAGLHLRDALTWSANDIRADQ